MAAEKDRIEIELERVSQRLAGAPRFEMTALYAAQQALTWVLDPASAQAPLESIVGSEGDSEGYLARSHPAPSSGT